MDHDHHGAPTATNNEHDEDQRDAMEVDGALDVATPDRSVREPPAFDENTERPRQRRRYHVTVEDEIRDGPSADDEVEILEAVPPRMSDLSIETPSTTPATATMRDPEPDSPHISTIPLPDVPPSSQPPLNPVMEAARRLTTSPDATNDQMQADLALLAPYIAAQAMAAAFPGAGRPPGGPTQGNGPPQPNAQAQEGQTPGQGATNNNNTNSNTNNTGNGMPPLPPFFFGLPPFMFGGNTEAPADPKRAERLANGLKVVEDGLLKRWKAVCGEEGAVCAVCYGELLEEPGIEREKDQDQVKDQSDEKSPEAQESNQDAVTDEHQRDLLEALKRREEMERLEEQEKALKLETAVLAFPCGHVFHRTCLLPWLSRHTTCPACRFDIDPKSDTLVLPTEDELPPFIGGPGGLNFGDYFTVGPVLRVPRSHIPGFGPGRGRPAGAANRPGAERANRPRGTEQGSRPEGAEQGDDLNSAEQGNRPEEGNGPDGEGDEGQAAGGNGDNATPTAARSVAELFDALLGSILAAHAGAGGPPRQEQEGREQETSTAVPDTAAPMPPPVAPAAESSAQSTPGDTPDTPIPEISPTTSPSQETPQSAPTASTSSTPSTNPQPEIQARTLDYGRPMAMFGRPTQRRPPQPITPAWMRQPRPANAPALRIVPNGPSPASAPSPRTVSSPVVSTPGGALPMRSVSGSEPGSPQTASGSASGSARASTGFGSAQTPLGSRPRPASTSPIAGLGQLRAIVSNLIPRRLSSSRSPSARASNAPSVRSNASAESVTRGATSPTSPRGATNPTSPRRPTSRGVTSPTSPRGVTSPIFSPREGGLRAMLHGPAALLRDLTTPASVRRANRTNADDMPALESDSETFSEDDVNRSDDESVPDDLPALEPIDERTRGGRRAPPDPEPETVAAPASEPAATQPPRPDNPPVDNIITLRIDLGHADGRDETIIVPLLFNPHGRPGNNTEQNQNQNQNQNRPPQEPRRPRTPPPPKKWTPPEPIKTFRQVVEEKEREAGWRCDDPACLLGPADDEEPAENPTIKATCSIMRPIGPDEEPVRYKIEDGIRVYADGEDVRVKGENPVCSHMLHPECLVTSARVNGYGPEHCNDAKRVTLRCPVCRLEGTVERQVWDTGVQADE